MNIDSTSQFYTAKPPKLIVIASRVLSSIDFRNLGRYEASIHYSTDSSLQQLVPQIKVCGRWGLAIIAVMVKVPGAVA